MAATEKIGRLRVRPQIKAGQPTGKVFVDIPGKLTEDGKRRRPLFDNHKTALAFAKQLWKQIQADRLTAGHAPPPSKGVSFAAAAEQWTEVQTLRMRAAHKRENSLATDLARLKPLEAAFAGCRVDAIAGSDVTRYQACRLQAGVKKRTVNAELSVLLSVLRAQGIARPQGVEFYAYEQVRHLVPTPAEVARILAELSGPRHVLVWLCAEAGLRPDEATHAVWEWFVRDQTGQPLLKVRRHADWEPKTAYSERDVPVSEPLLAAVLALPRRSRWVFPSRFKPEQPMDNIRKALKSATLRAGITREGKPVEFSLKMFRKAFGSALAEAKVSRAILQDLVGHKRGSPITEQFYTFHSDETVRAAAGRARLDLTGANLAISGNGAVARDKDPGVEGG